MFRAWSVLLGLAAGQESPIKPADPQVRRQEAEWVVTLALQADLPDDTIVQVQTRPVVLHFWEDRRTLIWEARESGAPARQALVRKKRAELRVVVPALRRVQVTYSVDPKLQTRGAVIKGDVAPVQRVWFLGSPTERMKALRDGYDKPLKSHARLLEIVKQLEQAERAKNPDRAAESMATALGEYRDRCAREASEGAFPGTSGFLAIVAGDISTYCSWLAKRKAAKDESGKSGTKNGENAEADGHKDSEGSSGSGPASKGQRDHRAIDKESAALFRKRVDCVGALHRAEALLIMDVELREMLERALAGSAPAPDDVREIEKAVAFLADRWGKELLPPHFTAATKALRGGDADALRKAVEEVKAHEAAGAKLP